jgi:hypothetical protein
MGRADCEQERAVEREDEKEYESEQELGPQAENASSRALVYFSDGVPAPSRIFLIRSWRSLSVWTWTSVCIFWIS